jgi:Ran GTPase-activating protein (RanGAP) involved in mRNA processing and transport
MKTHTNEVVTNLLLPSWLDLRSIVASISTGVSTNHIDIIDGNDYGRCETVRRLRSAMQHCKLQYLVISEIDMDENIIEALMDLLRAAPGPWEAVYLEFCEGKLDRTMESLFPLDTIKKLEVAGTISLSCMQAISEGLKQCKSLQELALLSTLDSQNVSTLIDGLKANTGLRALKFIKSTLMEDSIDSLVEFFRHNAKIEEVSLDRCIASESDLVALLTSLTDLLTLKELSIAGIACGEEIRLALLNLIRQNTLSRLSLRGLGSTGGNGMNELLMSHALSDNHSLRILDLSGNSLDDHTLEILIETMRSNATIEEVRLQENCITNKGACILGRRLHELRGLKRIFLHKNEFNENGIKAILYGIQRNHRIHEVTVPAVSGITKMSRLHVLINYETCLNAGGKQILRSRQFPIGLWPQVFERAGKVLFSPYCESQMKSLSKWKRVQQMDVMFYLLRHSDIGRFKQGQRPTVNR